jgi:hypothetical protein
VKKIVCVPFSRTLVIRQSKETAVPLSIGPSQGRATLRYRNDPHERRLWRR